MKNLSKYQLKKNHRNIKRASRPFSPMMKANSPWKRLGVLTIQMKITEKRNK